MVGEWKDVVGGLGSSTVGKWKDLVGGLDKFNRGRRVEGCSSRNEQVQ